MLKRKRFRLNPNQIDLSSLREDVNSDTESMPIEQHVNRTVPIDPFDIEAREKIQQLQQGKYREPVQQQIREQNTHGGFASINPFQHQEQEQSVTPSPIKRCVRLRETVKMYQKWMPMLSQSVSFDDLSLKSEAELEETLAEIRFCLGASNNVIFHQNLIEQGMHLLEAFGPMWGFNLSGLSSEARYDPQFQQLCQELVLASSEDGWEIMSPTNRLMVSVLGRIYQKHEDNSKVDNAMKLSSIIVDDETIEKYKHL
jgi:hypothetical protein